jgi:hypothetical protein
MSRLTNLLKRMNPDTTRRKARRRRTMNMDRLETRELLSSVAYHITETGRAGGDQLYAAVNGCDFQAMQDPKSVNFIYLDTPGRIDLYGGQFPFLLGNMFIVNDSPGRPTIDTDASNPTRVFTVQQGANVTLGGFDITGAVATDYSTGSGLKLGGAIQNLGQLMVSRCHIYDNFAATGGGAIENEGVLTVYGSTLDSNTTTGLGTAICNWPGATLSVVNSTISNNFAIGSNGETGGIWCGARSSVLISSSTIANNFCEYVDTPGHADPQGGGIRITFSYSDWANRAIVVLENSIVANNFHGNGSQADDVYGPLVNSSSFNNLIGNGEYEFGVSDGNAGNMVGSASAGKFYNIGLGYLQDNGGGIPTCALQLNSAAIGAGGMFSYPVTIDERGFPRPVGGRIDIGAFQYQGGNDGQGFAGNGNQGFAGGGDPGADLGADPGADAAADPGVDPGADPAADPAPGQDVAALNAQVRAYAQSQLGQQVGDGQCAVLADAALKSAGASSFADLGPTGDDADYVWGNLVTTLTTDSQDTSDVAPGDVIQVRDVTFVSTTFTPDGSWSQSTMAFPHHTAIVEAVNGGTITILEQNVNGDLTVQEATINLGDMTQGTMWVYQPVAGQGQAPAGDPGDPPVGDARVAQLVGPRQALAATPTKALTAVHDSDQVLNPPAFSILAVDQALSQLGQGDNKWQGLTGHKPVRPPSRSLLASIRHPVHDFASKPSDHAGR